MTVSELNNEQLKQLKINYLCEHLLEVENRTPSWNEIANASTTISDNLIFEQYSGIIFTEDDFY